MKNYLTDEIDACEFITGYSVIKEENVIRIQFANKKQFAVPYNKENEFHIQKLMNEQVNKARRNRLVTDRNLLGIVAVVSGVVAAIIGIGADQIPYMPEALAYAFPISTGIITLMSGIFTCKASGIIKDFDKSKFVLDNAAELNPKKIILNDELKKNLGLKVKNILNDNFTYYNKMYPINLNTVDELSLNELITLKEQLSFAQEFYNTSNNLKVKIKKM